MGDNLFDRKRDLGVFYTPEAYARVMVRWALNGSVGTVLDPSFGGCAMLRVAIEELQELGADAPADLVFGADIDEDAATWAERLVSLGAARAHLRSADFMALQADVDLPRASAVVGNPPYVRHHRLSPAVRAHASSVLLKAGVKLSGRASLWAYFVVHAVSFIQQGGRMALLLPGAIMQADYAPEVLRFLENRFDDVLLVRVRERIFADAREETVGLFASGAREAGERSTSRHEDVDNLGGLARVLDAADVNLTDESLKVREALPGVADWKLQLLSVESLDLARKFLSCGRVRPLGSVARVRLGTVTGANEFFVLSAADAERLAVEGASRSVLARSAWVKGPLISSVHPDLTATSERNRLLVLDSNYSLDTNPALGRSVDEAVRRGFDKRRHCRRAPWWALDAVTIPNAFLPYTVANPRGLAINAAGAASTNTVHQVDWLPGGRWASQERSWALSTWSSAGRFFTELYGRHYGGGILKLELSAAARLPVVDGLVIDDENWLACGEDVQRARELANKALIGANLNINSKDMMTFESAADELAEVRVGIPRTGKALNPM